MNNQNTVISEAIAKINTERTEQAVEQAVMLCVQISNENEKIVEATKAITQLREEAKTLANSVVTQESVLGATLPENANKDTIAKVVEKANKDRQGAIELKATRLTNSITAQQDIILAVEKRINNLRGELIKLTVPVVTVEQVVGQ